MLGAPINLVYKNLLIVVFLGFLLILVAFYPNNHEVHIYELCGEKWERILLATAYTDDKCRVFSTFIKDLDSRTRACPCMDPPRRKETRDDGDGTPRFCTHLEEIEQHHVSFNLVHVPCRAELLSIQRTYHIFDCDDSQVTRTTAPSKCLYVPEKPKDL
ncbi:uncharacterized protein LOC135595338 isoform X2 [Musa acuminata AAA Group]|uniref:uncharacterized protein LOC135595338 isoform X2 n=1 Tax=Musa acuminata AAA Group TaxID=214697 RepID=UPI0031CEAAE2